MMTEKLLGSQQTDLCNDVLVLDDHYGHTFFRCGCPPHGKGAHRTAFETKDHEHIVVTWIRRKK